MTRLSKRLLALAFFLFTLAGCPAFWRVAPTVLDKGSCILKWHDLPPEEIFVKCEVTPEERPAATKMLDEHNAQLRNVGACH